MPRSLENGDYSLVMAIESASRANSWYRVLKDRHSGDLSCDCPAWTFRQTNVLVATPTVRTCKHTQFAQQALASQAILSRAAGPAAAANILVQATRQQWPGLAGKWFIEERRNVTGFGTYHTVLLRLTTGNGTIASGLVAFTERHHTTPQSMVGGVAGWAGYTITAEVARVAGYPLAGQPPDHFKVTRSSTATRRRRLGLGDILRVGDLIDLGDGYSPQERAENTLRLFLGTELYAQLERQRFLDVSSVRFAHEQRVYRLRRDPEKLRDRRVRVFKHGEYVQDFCIVRNQDVPEADHWFTNFLSLLSDEDRAISVVQSYNIFPPHSDDYYEQEEETTPAVWRQNVA